MQPRAVGLWVLVAVTCGTFPADHTVLGAERLASVAVPQNVAGTGAVRRRLAQLLEQSATLRRQCGQIAAARHVYVAVRLRMTPDADSMLRAPRFAGISQVPFWRMWKYRPGPCSGVPRARVRACAGADRRCDLAALAASSGAARQVEAGVFESERARAAGRAVAGELYGTDVPVIGGIGRGVGRLARRLCARSGTHKC